MAEERPEERIRYAGPLEPVLARAAYAAEYIGAMREKFLRHNNTKSTRDWLAFGRLGLRKAHK